MNALETQVAEFLKKKGIILPSEGYQSYRFEKDNYYLSISFYDGKGSIFDASTDVFKCPIRKFKEKYIKDGQSLSDLTQLSGPVYGFCEGWKDRDRNRYEERRFYLHSPGQYEITCYDVLDETKICAETRYNCEGKFSVVQIWAFKEDSRTTRRDLYFPDQNGNHKPNNKYFVNKGWDFEWKLASERIVDIDFSYDEKEIRAILTKEGKPWYNWTFPRQNLSLSAKVDQLLTEFT